MAVWLHFMMARTAWAIDGNSSRPDDDRSDLSGNIRTAAGATSFCVKISTNCSSVRLGGVLKKWRIWGMRTFYYEKALTWLSEFSLCSVVGYDSCTLELAKGIDCSLNRCILWSWDCDLEDCTGSLLPIGNFALKNCNKKCLRNFSINF